MIYNYLFLTDTFSIFGTKETISVLDDAEVRKYAEGGVSGWLTVVGHFIITFLIFGFARVFSIFIVPFQVHYNISLTAVNALPAVYSIGMVIGGLFGGPFVERFGAQKAAIFVGGIPSFCFFTCYWFGIFYPGIVSCFAILAVAFGVLILCPLKSISNYFDTRRTFATQIGTCGTSFGQFVLAPLLTICIEKWSVTGAYLVISALFLNIFVSAYLFRPVKSAQIDQKEDRVQFDSGIFKMTTFQIYLVSQTLLMCG